MVTRWAVLLMWRALTLASTALGIAGVFLPILPTTPFLLLAAWAAGKGWPQFEAWLIEHPRLGPPIRRWRDHRAVPRSAKWAAVASMFLSAALLWWSAASLAIQLGVTLFLLAVAAWLWRRPET